MSTRKLFLLSAGMLFMAVQSFSQQQDSPAPVQIVINLPVDSADQILDDFIASIPFSKSDKINGDANPLVGHETERVAKIQFVRDRLQDQLAAGAARTASNKAAAAATSDIKAKLKSAKQ